MKRYSIRYNGPFFSGCMEVSAKSKKQAVHQVKKAHKELGIKIKVISVMEVWR